MQKTYDEIAKMSPAQLKSYKEGQRDIVFGEKGPRDRKGKREEQGIGSAAQPSINHVEALRKAEPHNVEAIQAAEKALADFNAKNRAKQRDHLLADL